MNSKAHCDFSGAVAESALASYHQAISAFNLYRGDPVSLLDKAMATAPDFAAAGIAKIIMLALSTEPAALADARVLVDRVGRLKLDEQETSLFFASSLLAAGRWNEAGHALDRHSMEYPRDILALQAGHLVDFYCANSRNLRERIARVLPGWDASVPGFPVVLGMYAFGLEEDGHYSKAEDVGRQAVALEPYDSWAHHAVAHVMEMQGRAEDGIGWMISRQPYWSGDDNFFKVHNWWHRAVYHIELGQHEDALAIYDGPVRESKSGVVLDLVDATALLWRLHLMGVDAGDRWTELAAMWQTHADGQTYPFNDWHAAMAYLGAGKDTLLAQLTDSMTAAIGSSPEGEWIARIGLPLINGFSEFYRGNHKQAVEKLLSVRRFSGVFGGSHAQRDIIDLTLIEAACRGGMQAVSRALINERLSVRPHSMMVRKFLGRTSRKCTSPLS